MIEESRFNKSLSWLLIACAIGVFWLAVGESVVHITLDVLGLNVHPIQNTGRMNGLIAIITVIVGGQKGGQWLNYKRERDCRITPETISPEVQPRHHKK